jgi:hypothetical protein
MCIKMLLTLELLASTLLAGSATQTDWSGGPGAPGPVTGWTDTFSTSYLIDWHRTPGSVKIDQNALSHTVMSTTTGYLSWSKPCDLNNDSYPDIFLQWGSSSHCALYTNQGAGGPGEFLLTDGWYYTLEDMGSGDINGDGLPDFVAAPGVGEFFWMERLSGSGWSEHLLSTGIVYPILVNIVDLDSDEDSDVIGVYRVLSSSQDPYLYVISWWENLGDGSSWEMHTIQQSGGISLLTSLDVSDYDGDGDYDVVCGSESNELYLFVNEGTADGWTFQVIEYQTEGELQKVSFADLDGDEQQELLTTGFYATAEVLYFDESSPGNWTAHLITSYPYRVLYAVPGDFDGDGDLDIAVNSTAQGTNPYHLMWYENLNGDASEWVFHPVISNDTDPSWVTQCADFDQNGTDDFLATNHQSGSTTYKVIWWDFLPGVYHLGQCLLESSILQVDDAAWSTIDWSATLPSQTTVKFQVRSSNNPADMGSWSSNIFSPGSVLPYVTSGDDYFQYRAVLETLEPTATPVLNSVTISWNPVGIEGGEEPSAFSMEPLRNPAVGLVELRLSLPSLMHVRLDVFDVSGRVVAKVIDEELEQGNHTIQVSDLAPGLYLARLVAGSETLVERLTVIER